MNLRLYTLCACLFLINIYSFAQNTYKGKQHTLESDIKTEVYDRKPYAFIDEEQYFIARDEITLLPGFSAKAGQEIRHKTLLLKDKKLDKLVLGIDETLIYDVDYLSESEIIDPAERNVKSNSNVGGVTGTFNVNDRGASTYTIPIEVPPGSNGFTPNLSINHNSESGLGNIGVTWSVNTENVITRVGDESGRVNLNSNDNYTINGNLMLMLNQKNNGDDMYATKVPTFTKIIAEGSGSNNNPTSFTVKHGDGSVTKYGTTSNSKLMVTNEDNSSVPLLWYISEQTDKFGNSIKYEYYNEGSNGRIFLKRISYATNASGNYLNEILFIYGTYQTRFDNKLFDNTLKSNVIIQKIQVLSGGNAVNEYSFDYLSGSHPRLSAINNKINGSKRNSLLVEWGEVTDKQASLVVAKPYLYGSSGESKELKPLIADFNGDGKDDYVGDDGYVYLASGSNESISFQKKTNSNISPDGYTFAGYFNDDNYADILKLQFTDNTAKFLIYSGDKNNGINTSSPVVKYQVELPEKKIIRQGDFDGDGYTDIVCLSTTETSGSYYPFGPGKSIGTISFTKEISRAKSADIDGDGNDEFVCLNEDNEFKILSYDGSSSIVENSATFTHYTSGYDRIMKGGYSQMDHIRRHFEVEDYNGDGKADIIFPDGYLYLSNGVNFNDKIDFTGHPSFIMPIYEKYNSRSFHFRLYKICLFDDNGDGIKDLHSYGGMRIATTSSSWTAINRYSPSNTIYIGNFNGYGGADYIKWYYSNNATELNFSDNENYSFQVKKITNGHGGSVEIANNLRSNSNIGDFNPRIEALAASLNGNYLVSQVKLNAQGVNEQTINYTYEDNSYDNLAKFTKGFLGFKKIITNNTSTNTQVTKWFKFEHTNTDDDKLIRPYLEKKEVKVDGEITSYLYNKDIGMARTYAEFNGDEKSFHLYTKVKEETNQHELKVTTTNSLGSDKYGRIQTKTVNYNGVQTVTTNYAYKTQPGNLNGEFEISKLETETITSTHEDADGENHVITKNYEYYSSGSADGKKGWLKSLTTNNRADIKEHFKYNKNNGRVTEHQKGGRITKYEYDPYGRFQEKVTDAVNDYVENTYNTWGNLQSTKSSTDASQVTSFSYDNMNRLTRTTYPNGTWQSVKYEWSEDNKVLFKQTTEGSDGSVTIVETNGLKQKVKEKTKLFDGTYSTVEYTYHPDGSLASESIPYTSGSPTFINYTYNKGLLQTKKCNAINVDMKYVYSNSASKYYTVAETNQAHANNPETKKKYNILGKIVQLTDPEGGIINYKYYASGQLHTITPPGGNTTTELFYDELGRKIGMIDPSMGTIVYNGNNYSVHYDYNEFDELTYTTDANGNSVTYAPDPLTGLLDSETDKDGIVTNYTYYQSGANKHMLESVSIGADKEISYTYDKYGNVLSKTEKIDGSTYTFGYTYNSQGALATKTYPGSTLKLSYSYQNGYLKSISNASNSKVYWQCNAVNEKGIVTEANIGSHFKSEYAYDANTFLPNYTKVTNTSANSNIYYQDYEFNTDMVSLAWREDKLVSGLKEEFDYDDMNRLVYAHNLHSGDEWDLTYKSDKSGRVEYQTNVGTLTYGESNKPYQVSQVSDPANYPSLDLTFEYTSFDKVKLITYDVTETTSNTLEIEYGPNKVRSTGVYKENGSQIWKRTYMGEFEILEKDGTTTRLYYIDAPTGIVGVMEETGSTQTMNYVFTDYLGSWNVVANEDGSVVERMSFDAWGNRRETDTWTNDNSLRYKFNRGFTGHEHYDEFSIINMNGRMYDPVMGQFLSLDPFVQNPGNTTNFNRYGYAVGNPLIYTDPDGEFIIPALIGAAVSVITNGIANEINDRPFFEGAGKSAIFGAIGGAFSFGIGNIAKDMALAGANPFLFQTIAHGTLGGSMSMMQGGEFMQGFVSGAVGSMAGSVFNNAMSGVTSKSGRVFGTIAFGALSGGISAEMAGGEFWDGFRNGAISAGLNHVGNDIVNGIKNPKWFNDIKTGQTNRINGYSTVNKEVMKGADLYNYLKEYQDFYNKLGTVIGSDISFWGATGTGALTLKITLKAGPTFTVSTVVGGYLYKMGKHCGDIANSYSNARAEVYNMKNPLPTNIYMVQRTSVSFYNGMSTHFTTQTFYMPDGKEFMNIVK